LDCIHDRSSQLLSRRPVTSRVPKVQRNNLRKCFLIMCSHRCFSRKWSETIITIQCRLVKL
jgi:hypothetical protein